MRLTRVRMMKKNMGKMEEIVKLKGDIVSGNLRRAKITMRTMPLILKMQTSSRLKVNNNFKEGLAQEGILRKDQQRIKTNTNPIHPIN